MLTKKLTTVLVIASAVAGFSGAARAAEGTDDFGMLFKMQMMDKNKDGMVAKKEFMAMVDKAYDMAAQKMGAKAGMLTEAQMKEFLKMLYTGG